jgi:Tfp pilus assembly protein PilF
MDDENVQAHQLLAEVLQAEGKSELAVHETKYAITLAKKNPKPK